MGVTAQSNWKFNIVQSGVHHASNPDPYRGCFGSNGLKYAEDVQGLIDYGTSGRVAGFTTEAIQGVGGIVELAPGNLPAAYNSVKKIGGLCIADEVQLGFARIGSHFWGFETHGVVLNIVTMAKGIGSGIPIGVAVTTPEIAQCLMSLKEKYEIIGDVRARGLILGLELVTDRQLKTPAKVKILHIMN
ncbi:hypothetical protein GIB67_009766 [Kingdonia uniflora]|uniref:Uncharacterized protein n=1 Tax=Kingdonia uniflora TaxID=39325 RepID=A0A7J7LXC1_9MAGN|nr:hypothetical protein GIB67_009766 [Kingdonia uniflora]